MKRRLARISVFLLLGAVVNVAVAWGHALMVDAHVNSRSSTGSYIDLDLGEWHLDRWDRIGSTAVHALHYALEYASPGDLSDAISDFVPWWAARRREALQSFDPEAVAFGKHLLEARGLPLRSFHQEFEMVHLPGDPTIVNIAWIVHGGVRMPIEGAFTPRAIPLRPIWTGITINSIFYAILLWLGVRGWSRYLAHVYGSEEMRLRPPPVVKAAASWRFTWGTLGTAAVVIVGAVVLQIVVSFWLDRGWERWPTHVMPADPALYEARFGVPQPLRATMERHRSKSCERIAYVVVYEERAFGSSSGQWIRLGFPLRAFEGGLLHDGHVRSIPVQYDSPMRWLVTTEFLPCGIIWPGFIVNTLLYASLLWLPFRGPFVLRRHLRRRRGLCEKCAYPIGVSPVCTECGAAVRSVERRHSRPIGDAAD